MWSGISTIRSRPTSSNLDLITFFFAYHDITYMPVDRAVMNKKMFAALKPGGFLVIADHSAKPGDGITVAKTLHRIEESTLRQEIEAAGFKLVAEARFPAPSRRSARYAGVPAENAGRRIRAEIPEADVRRRLA